ncbi:MAG: sugar transferase, partial [Bacteroidia bacterium]|nr:sugar transferase [Bacteroidia bacterium]
MSSVEPSKNYDGLAYLNSGYRRGLDVLLCMVLWFPVHAVLGLVWLGTLGIRQNSFLFVQERIGRRGQVFLIYKLRTIRTNH